MKLRFSGKQILTLQNNTFTAGVPNAFAKN